MQHIPADELEAYALGRVTEPELTGIEEHLLVCAECQDRLEEEKKLVDVIRAALAQSASGNDIRVRIRFASLDDLRARRGG